jgi:hypothetical protein
MNSSTAGILAIWNDCAGGREADFEHWFQSEHLAERLAVPGFRRGRRYEAVSGAPKYFVFYLTDAPEVLTSPAYLDRVNNPTALTVEMMSNVFRNMNRTVCSIAEQRGAVRGTWAVTSRFMDEQNGAALSAALQELMRDDGVACGEIWTAAGTPTSTSEEEKLRGGDRKIRHCLLIETLRKADARDVAGKVTERFGKSADVGIYRLLCDLQSPSEK